jgi:4'-phosphopantetheinyl transferase
LLGRQSAKKLLLGCPLGLKLGDSTEISIENELDGAPYVLYQNRTVDLNLSISHRDRLAFCALSAGSRINIGADIEKIEPRESVFVEDYFTVEEQRFVADASLEIRETYVTLIWSAKEAALKALRKGLRLDTRSVEIQEIIPGADEWGSYKIFNHQSVSGSWYGWWHRRGEYVLTLAVYSVDENIEEYSLVQIN